MTREALLKASIREFRDNENNALVWTIERHFTKSGFCYILLKESREISCAIHYNSSFDTDENVGKYENNDVAINTREKLDFWSEIIEYKGFYVAISSVGNYNETMAQWHYAGQGAFKPISDRFLITSEAEILDIVGSNSLYILMSLDLGYSVVPSYYSAFDKSSYIMASINATEPLNINHFDIKENAYIQYRKDSVKLSFVNIDTLECMKVIQKINDYAISKNAEFGINSFGALKDENFYQKSFNWKSLVYSYEFDINYYLKVSDSSQETAKRITQIFYDSVTKI